MTRKIASLGRETLASIILRTFAEVYASPIFRYSIAACVLGLSLARLVHSVSLLSLDAAGQPKRVHIEITAPAKAEQSTAEISAIVGGALFRPQAAQREMPVLTETSLKPFKLMGTLEGSNEYARALIEIQGEGIREYCARGASCSKGECACSLQGANVTSIAKEYILLRVNGSTAKLAMGQSSADLKIAQSNRTPPAAGTNTVAKTISRETVRKILRGDVAGIFAGGFGPYVVNGKVSGYKIHQIAPDHVFAVLGAQNGDIVRRVNGYELNDFERMLDIWREVPTMNEVKIEIIRDGKNIVYDFQIRN